jgi:hypothetical protein
MQHTGPKKYRLWTPFAAKIFPIRNWLSNIPVHSLFAETTHRPAYHKSILTLNIWVKR